MLDISQFRFLDETPPRWFYTSPDLVEVYILGDANSPDIRRFEVAQQIMPHLEKLETSASESLHSFFKDSKTIDDHDLHWLEFGKTICDPVDEFSLYFHIGMSDIYGLYYATFKLKTVLKHLETGFLFPARIGRESR